MVGALLWVIKRVGFLSIYLAIQYSLYKRTISHFGASPIGENHRNRLVMGARSFFITISLPSLCYLIPDARLYLSTMGAAPLLYASEIWMPSSVFIFLLLVGQDMVRALTKRRMRAPAATAEPVEASRDPEAPAPTILPRRQFIRMASGLLATTPVAAFTYGMSISKTNFKVEKTMIPIKNLPKSLEGLRICQLTDIHYESFIFPEDLAYVVEVANSLDPDLIFLTGDYLTEQREMAQPFIEVFRHLRAKEGIYGCFGNHEDYSRTHEIFTQGFRRGGIEMLRDQITDVRVRGEMLRLIGIDWVGHKLRSRAVQVIHKAMGKHPTILLSHQPNMFPLAAAAGVDLTVSGHTHGGQIAFELGIARISPSQFITPYNAGWYRQDNANLYVSRGIGTVALPLRLNAPPEITLLELTSG